MNTTPYFGKENPVSNNEWISDITFEVQTRNRLRHIAKITLPVPLKEYAIVSIDFPDFQLGETIISREDYVFRAIPIKVISDNAMYRCELRFNGQRNTFQFTRRATLKIGCFQMVRV